MQLGAGTSDLVLPGLDAAVPVITSAPAVVAAAPGIRSYLDLPLVTGRAAAGLG